MPASPMVARTADGDLCSSGHQFSRRAPQMSIHIGEDRFINLPFTAKPGENNVRLGPSQRSERTLERPFGSLVIPAQSGAARFGPCAAQVPLTAPFPIDIFNNLPLSDRETFVVRGRIGPHRRQFVGRDQPALCPQRQPSLEHDGSGLGLIFGNLVFAKVASSGECRCFGSWH